MSRETAFDALPMDVVREILARVVRDLALAEDLAHDALGAAPEQWPRDGLPHNPGAWLMATARHRAVDALRRGRMLADKHAMLEAEAPRAALWRRY